MHQRQRRIDLQRAFDDAELVSPGLGSQHANKRRHDVVADHQQPRQTPRLAVGDGAFFHVGLGAGNLVMVEVQVTANPWIDGAGSRQPDQAHHQVVRHPLLAEVHAMDQVMLKFVGQRGEERIEQQARPPGHVPADVECCAADHPGPPR